MCSMPSSATVARQYTSPIIGNAAVLNHSTGTASAVATACRILSIMSGPSPSFSSDLKSLTAHSALTGIRAAVRGRRLRDAPQTLATAVRITLTGGYALNLAEFAHETDDGGCPL